MNNLRLLDEPSKLTGYKRNLNAGLTVEMTTDSMAMNPAQLTTHPELNNKGLPVETTVQASGDKTKKNKNTNSNEATSNEQSDNNEDKEMKTDNEKDSESSTVSEAALGLIMLQDNNPTDNSLLQKYDNSQLMLVDAARQTDYSTKPETELADNDNDISHDSDDTVILQEEIEDTIGDTTDNIAIPAKIRHDTGLPVEMTGNNTTLDTSSITKELSNLSVSPVSPNKGKVVFKSYRLRHRATDTGNETSSKSTSTITASKPNPENDIQLANIPSGNSTRPPPPDKYKIRKYPD